MIPSSQVVELARKPANFTMDVEEQGVSFSPDCQVVVVLHPQQYRGAPESAHRNIAFKSMLLRNLSLVLTERLTADR